MCYENSFACHNKSKYWSERNKLTARQVSKWSHDKYWFKCGECNHEFEKCLNSIQQGGWCAYCTNKKLCDEPCNMCYENSYASLPDAKNWDHEKNTRTPRSLFKYSEIDKFWFICPTCQLSFQKMLAGGKTLGCPVCKNKTEKMIADYIMLLDYNFTSQTKFEWCKNKTYLPFDFLITDLNLIIELDGRQHFVEIDLFKNDPDEITNNDRKKMSLALDHGYSVIRLIQEEVYYDKFDWKQRLKDLFELLLVSPTDEPFIEYITKDKNNKIYDRHRIAYIDTNKVEGE